MENQIKIQYIKNNRQIIYVYLLIALLGLLAFSFFKNPNSFPGLETRVLWALGIVFVIALIDLGFYFDQKIDISGYNSLVQKFVNFLKKSVDYCKSSKILEYVFLLLLALVVLASLKFEFMALVSEFLSRFNITLVVLSIIVGFFVFWKNRDRVERETEDEKNDEERAESKRAREFDSKFPKISKIWGLGSLVRWMYKEGWWYSVGLILIVLLFIVSHTLLNIHKTSLGDDEYPTYYSSLTLFELPSGNDYIRGAPLQILLHVLSFFTTNVYLFRSINLLLGIGFILLVYKKIKNKNLSLAFILFFITNALLLSWATEIRHYFLFSMLVFILFLYRSCKLYILLPLLLLTIFSSELSIVPVSLFCLIYLVTRLSKSSQKFLRYFLVGLSIALPLFSKTLYYLAQQILPSKFLTTLSPEINTFYLLFLIQKFPFLFILSLGGFYYFIASKNYLASDNAVLVLFSVSLISSILSWNDPKYILFLFPSMIYLSCYALFFIGKTFNLSAKSTLIFLIPFLLLFLSGLTSPNTEYGMNHPVYNLSPLNAEFHDNVTLVTTTQFRAYQFLDSENISVKKVYWLRRESALQENYISDNQDYWIGYEYIGGLTEEFIELNRPVILLADQRLRSTRYTDAYSSEIINRNFEEIYSSSNISLYKQK